MSEDQRIEIREAFDLFDAERAGSIDYASLKTCLRALGYEVSKEAVRAAVAERGDEGGRVDFAAFEAIVGELHAQRDPEDAMRKAFALFDEDGQGKISVKNLRRVARELGEALSDEDLAAMVEEFDVDQDGMISLEEFLEIMRQTSLF